MARNRIVLIDDNVADILILRRCLENLSADFEIIVLKDGAEALQFVEKERHGVELTPCIIVLDLVLPKYDGLEILAAIRVTPPLSHITVMILTGRTSPEDKRKIEELGATYTEKPSTLEEYQNLAARILDMCGSTVAAH